MQAKVHQQEGKEYDPARWIDPESVATTILTALDLPGDAEINDLTVRAGAAEGGPRSNRTPGRYVGFGVSDDSQFRFGAATGSDPCRG